ncbi:MAG: HDIG domain-containing protein [Anaerolineae bacterium]|nr:HDIG domain-containing protein [Anaerolineae bacterium]
MNRDQALEIVRQYIQSENLVNHMLATEAAMGYYAVLLQQDVEQWKITGLLHDFDWEIHPDADSHPSQGAPILREFGVDEEIIQAILGHGSHTGVPRTTLLAKALYACDEITGLITACVLVRPSKSINDLEVSSVKKKWKNFNFAAGANRYEMEAAAAEFGVDLWEHVGNIIASMRSIAGQIGLAGENGSGTIA